MRHCKGLCKNVNELYKQDRKIGYIEHVDRKYCSQCEYWLVCELIRCPCCLNTLRVFPRDNKSGQKKRLIFIS